jgi:hypothetical protein
VTALLAHWPLVLTGVVAFVLCATLLWVSGIGPLLIREAFTIEGDE